MSSSYRNLMRSRTAYQQLFDITLALVLVFAIQASRQSTQARKTQGRADQAELDAAEQARIAGEAMREARDEKQRNEAIEGELDEIKREIGAPFRLKLVCDATGSMNEELKELASTVRTIVEVLTEVGRSVEISLIAYREEVVVSMPLTKIVPPGKDGGRSLRNLNAYLTRLQAVGAYANVPLAIEQAVRQDPPFDGKEVILWLADQDAREAATLMKQGSQTDLEQLILARLVGWATRPGTDRRVISFFASDEVTTAPPLFKRIATETPRGLFKDDTMDLLSVLLAAALPVAE